MTLKLKSNSDSLLSSSRFILWEVVGLVGFLHILYYAPAKDPVPLIFLSNAMVFLLIYPIVYFYNRLSVPTFLKFLVSPLHAFLQVILLITIYIWVTYVLYATQYCLDHVFVYEDFASYYWVLCPIFILVYFFFFEHLLGVGEEMHSFWFLAGLLSDGISGVVLGYGLGQTLDTKWGMFFGGYPLRVLFWTLFVFIGVIVVV